MTPSTLEFKSNLQTTAVGRKVKLFFGGGGGKDGVVHKYGMKVLFV